MEDELQRCASCRAERMCRWYETQEVWLCVAGADKCWRRRKSRSQRGLVRTH